MYEIIGFSMWSFFYGIICLIIVVVSLIAVSISISRTNRIQDRYDAFEVALLGKLADKQNINLIRELKTLELDSNKTFKKRLQEQIIEEFFEKNGNKKKEK